MSPGPAASSRRRGAMACACSRANRTSFKPQPFAPEKQPHRIVRHLHPRAANSSLSPCSVRSGARGHPLRDEGPMLVRQGSASATSHGEPRRPVPPTPLHPPDHRGRRNPERRAADRQLSPSSTGATTRSRRSIHNVVDADVFSSILNRGAPRPGSPYRFISSVSAPVRRVASPDQAAPTTASLSWTSLRSCEPLRRRGGPFRRRNSRHSAWRSPPPAG
jgi:hypothetical protein